MKKKVSKWVEENKKRIEREQLNFAIRRHEKAFTRSRNRPAERISKWIDRVEGRIQANGGKDPADDGPEILIIRFFKRNPKGYMEHYRNATPFWVEYHRARLAKP